MCASNRALISECSELQYQYSVFSILFYNVSFSEKKTKQNFKSIYFFKTEAVKA